MVKVGDQSQTRSSQKLQQNEPKTNSMSASVFGLGKTAVDTKALFDASMSAKQIPLDRLEEAIELNNKKINAYVEFGEKLSNLQKSLEPLRKVSSHDAINSFDKRIANLSINSQNSAESYVNVKAAANAHVNQYSITIDQLAAAKQEKSTNFSSKTASVTEAAGGTTPSMFSAGVFQLNGINVTISQGFNLTQIADAINAVSAESNVKAYIMQIADNSFRLYLKSNQTGLANAYVLTDTNNVMTQANFTTATSALDASFSIDGQAITRPTNEIDDVVENVTFSLKKKTDVGEQLLVNIENDIETVYRDLEIFSQAYNEMMNFYAKQNEREKNVSSDKVIYKETAYLAKERTLSSIILDIQSELMIPVAGLTGNYRMLADVNMTFKEFKGDDKWLPFKNAMFYDENLSNFEKSSIRDILKSDFENVRKIFEFTLTASTGNVFPYDRTNALNVNIFQMDIDDSRAVGNEVIVTYEDVHGVIKTINADYDNSGSPKITGKSGTVLEGFSMLYVGSGVDVIDVKVTQGIADRVNNLIKQKLDEVNGEIRNSIKYLMENNQSKEKEMERLALNNESYKKSLLKKISDLERVSSKSKSIMSMLDASARAREND